MPPAAPKTPATEAPETPEKRALRVERIKALIQQASSPAGDGAAAAIRACALIRKFDLDVVDPMLVDGLYKEIHTLRVELEASKAVNEQGAASSSPNFGGSVNLSGILTSAFTSAYHPSTMPMTASTMPWPPNNWSSPPPPAAGPSPSHATPSAAGAPSNMTAPRLIKLKFRGKCSQCGRAYDVDDEALWLKIAGQGTRIWCPPNVSPRCYPDWQRLQQQVSGFNPGVI